MSPLVTAILMLCSSGDPKVATMVEQEAIRQDIDPAWALVVGLMESGLKEGNTMGTGNCYGSKAARKGTATCIRLGVESLHNRLWDAHTSLPTASQFKQCGSTGNLEGCRALLVYNGSRDKMPNGLERKVVYARTGVGLFFKVHKLAEKARKQS